MNKNAPVRIMIVEDHHIVRAGLVAMIGTQPNMAVVAEAGDGVSAVTLHNQHKPDVTIVDLRMPGMSGVEVIREIRKRAPESRFVVLTTYEGEEDIYGALEAGAQAYLLKGMFREELMETILAVHAGLRRIPKEVERRLTNRIPAELTAREMDVLRLIVKGENNKEIAEHLHITEGTVKWYVNHILNKLGVSDRLQASTAAIKRGLVHFDE